MKKLKSLFISAALFALSLVSCGTQGYHGRYQFQMGKANDAHIGIYMNLTTDKIDIDIEETKTTFEKFVLRLETPDSLVVSSQSLAKKDYPVDIKSSLKKVKMSID